MPTKKTAPQKNKAPRKSATKTATTPKAKRAKAAKKTTKTGLKKNTATKLTAKSSKKASAKRRVKKPTTASGAASVTALPVRRHVTGAIKKPGIPGRGHSIRESALLEGKDHTFKVGDNAFYPGHGVGRVSAVETKEICGYKQQFYIIDILKTNTRVMVPINNVKTVGLRPIISETEAEKVLDILRTKSDKIDHQTWNRRYRDYMEKIKTGSVYEIAKVLRDLYFLRVEKELSFGERKMLDTARGMLFKELSLSKSPQELREHKGARAIFFTD